MKLISHRGNLRGPKTSEENSLSAIYHAINLGFDVEVDIRYQDNNFYLGHDQAEYKVTLEQLDSIKTKLWIHCKNFIALDRLHGSDFNYFFHQKDDHTLTSKGYIWTFPGKDQGNNNILVMPEYTVPVPHILELAAFGICSDYILTITESITTQGSLEGHNHTAYNS